MLTSDEVEELKGLKSDLSKNGSLYLTKKEASDYFAISKQLIDYYTKKNNNKFPEYIKGTKVDVLNEKLILKINKKKFKKGELNSQTSETSDETKSLAERAEVAKYEQEIYKAAKLKNDLEASRNKLISRELVADVMVAYLDSLSKEIMQMPVSVIQEIAAGIEAGKSNIELVNDLRKHLSTAIANTKRTSINTMKRLLK
jgi:hypothetical protein